MLVEEGVTGVFDPLLEDHVSDDLGEHADLFLSPDLHSASQLWWGDRMQAGGDHDVDLRVGVDELGETVPQALSVGHVEVGGDLDHTGVGADRSDTGVLDTVGCGVDRQDTTSRYRQAGACEVVPRADR